eukprot:CAMPEP_0176425242 /NCGR_PEP_ID=MMETSP0127-20121128/11283_1 /TAXON_ID=938130 /ORGANISM="Platyophrya macrostoma, Strain WH" /LENGTH=524 /DNA_ID=CAMNT_0017806387 /DNA_START=131 /DNA_END=1705 /DNA_ORIENTATION=-
MRSALPTISLVVLLLSFLASAKLEPRYIPDETDEIFAKIHAQTSFTETNDDICTTNLTVGESFSYNVRENVTAGYLNINSSSSSALFFIFYKCRNLTSDTYFRETPLVIWLQGGPGSSSLLGAFNEIGPYHIVWNETNQKYEEQVQPHAWSDYYHLLVIDNPVGVGFGNLADVNDLTQNETRVADHMLTALLNFYRNSNLSEFSTLSKTPLYIFGESYAGHYIPSICDRILRHNNQTGEFQIPLKGAGIGNGWVDPPNQLSEFGLFGQALGLIDEDERATIEGAQLDAVFNIKYGRQLLAQGNYQAASKYMKAALDDFDIITGTLVNGSGQANVYNYRIYGPYNNTNLITYLNYPETQKSYCIRGSRLGNRNWTKTSDLVHESMSAYDFMNTVAANVSNILNSIPVMFYNGQDDIICNSPSTQTLLSKLEWTYQNEFYTAKPQVWYMNNGTHAGFAKNYDNLTYVTVNAAGHLAPMDQIVSTTEMLRRFIGGNKNWTAPYNPTTPSAETLFFDEDEFLIKANMN